MNLKIFLMGIVCLAAINVQADTLEKMKRLPGKIVIDTVDNTLNFTKGTRPDSFSVMENDEIGNGYRQTYHNDVCYASVTYQPALVGRMSNVKIKRHLKDITRFQITAQDAYKAGTESFYMNVGTTPEQTTVLMLSGKGKAFLKVHLSCQALPNFSERVHGKAVVSWAKKIADAAVMVYADSKKEK